jgi:ABC-type sugar transport system ATPase subunit
MCAILQGDDSTIGKLQRPPALRLSGIVKRFGGIEVLHGIDLEVKEGEIHGIIGENGAGKSTLMKIVAGLLRPSSGTVEIDGAPLTQGRGEARKKRVVLVHQELSLVPALSVAENCVLGAMPTVGGVVRHRMVRRKAQRALESIAPYLDLDMRVERLRFADRQLVEIARALMGRPRILMLDEPTSSLSPVDARKLFALLRGLRDEEGTTILYVSHRLPEVRDLCERVSVLRDGSIVATDDVDGVSEESLAHSMVGRKLDLLTRRAANASAKTTEVVLKVEDLRGPGVAGVSLTVRRGEICGVAGLIGAGRTELARLLVGLARPQHGYIEYLGKEVRFRSARESVSAGIAFVPEDRGAEGLALDLTTASNLLIPSLVRGQVSGIGGWVNSQAARSVVSSLISQVGVVPTDPRMFVRHLSGGNQQKVVIGRWLPVHPHLLILDEPTRGVDIGAKSELHARIAELAAANAAILLISSDIPELLSLADRILVMRDGRIAGEVGRDRWSEQEVITLASTALGAQPVAGP